MYFKLILKFNQFISTSNLNTLNQNSHLSHIAEKKSNSDILKNMGSMNKFFKYSSNHFNHAKGSV